MLNPVMGNMGAIARNSFCVNVFEWLYVER